MDEIGRKLRERRLERGLEIAQVEADTRIRGKYLRALEEERFDVLPGGAYARAFLRDYAEELGLDGQELVDALNARSGPPEDVVLTPPRTAGPLEVPWSSGRRALGWIVLAAAAVAAGALVLLVLSQSGGGGAGTAASTPISSSPPSSSPPSGSTSVTAPPAHHAAAALVLSAIGPCWVEVRAASAVGQVLYTGVLEAGDARRYHRRTLWVRVGAPWNLVVRAGGHRLSMPLSTAGNVLVTPAAVTSA